MSGSLSYFGAGRHVSNLEVVSRAAGVGGLGLLAVIVALNNVIARAPAGATYIAKRLLPPGSDAVMGSDALGRDIMSETVHALAVSFSSAAVSTAIAIFIGALAGFAAVRLPLRMGAAVRVISGILRMIPTLFLAVVLVALSSREFFAISVGLAICPEVFNAGFDRASSLARSRHAMYARASGIPGLTLLRRDLVYELRMNIVNVTGRALASSATILATISFFGFGAIPPHRDLGLLIAEAQTSYLSNWWCALFPALALVVLVLCARLAATDDSGQPS